MNINIRLNKNFTTQYNKLQDEFGTDIAKINGFDDGQLSYTDFIDNFVDQSTVADASIDGNSNVSHKDIVTLEKEMPKPHEKLLAFNKIYYEIQKKYGFQTANEWLRAEWIGWLYMHDANTTSFKHYCFAYDLKDLAENGLYFIEGRNAEPAKHLSTFVDFVKEYISYACNRSSGAVGLPNLIPYMFYFWKKDVDDGYYVRNKEYYAKQQFQRFIYAVNQPYLRDGSQSAFTNTSVFDRPYFEALFGGTEFPDGTFMIDYEEEIIEFQKWYMEVMAKIRHENMFTFPVSTISLLRQNGKFVDEDFATWAIKHNMEWSDSNIFCDSSVNSLSNCCRLKSNIEDLGYFNIPLGIKTTGQERVRIASEFDGYCSGGSILHYNIDAPFDSFEKAWKMTNYIADQGVTYFAFNTKIQACKHNHAFYGTKCPICGEPVDTEFTRIVGFYTPVKTYSKERKAEFEMRKWGDINAEVEEI